MQFVVGEVFHRLTALSRDGRYGTYRCTCGNEKRICVYKVFSGHTKSCGCFRKEVTAQNTHALKTTHGMTHTRVYDVWRTMLARCTNPNHRQWERYGGRGIKVCDAWRKFESFYVDMGDPPAKLTLERRNNSQGYSAANCYWATQTEQNNNRRSNIRITYNGLTFSPAQWAEKLGIKRKLIYDRRHRGMPVEKVLSPSI